MCDSDDQQDHSSSDRAVVAFSGPGPLAPSAAGIFHAAQVVALLRGPGLGLIWLGHAAVGVLTRQPMDRTSFGDWVPVGIMAYGLWHFLKVACYRPEEAMELTPAEHELLRGAPLRRHDLVVYRLACIATSAALKSVCFCVLMLPDLRVWVAAVLGSFLALLFLDLVRMVAEIMAWGVSTPTYLRFRSVAVLLAGSVTVIALVITLCEPGMWHRWGNSMGFLIQLFQAAVELRHTWIGVVVECLAACSAIRSRPTRTGCRWQVRCWRQGRWSWPWCGWCCGWTLTFFTPPRMPSSAVTSSWRWAAQPALGRGAGTRSAAHSLPSGRGTPGVAASGRCASVCDGHDAGIGRARRVGLPPVAGAAEHYSSRVELVGILAFYSLVLLPSALKFDFRRDLDYFALLKSLPIRPIAMAAGQIATPVLLATAFQLIILVIAATLRPFPVGVWVAALLVLVPLNILSMGLENLVYLLYPYRLNQEGLEIFVRATLTFTAKGALFGLALGAAAAWAVVAARLAGMGDDWISRPALDQTVFFSGICLAISLGAAVITWLLARAYSRLDPSQDVPS